MRYRLSAYFMALMVGTSAVAEKPGTIQREARLHHARELLGKYYDKSVVASGEGIRKINRRIYTWTREHLPAKFKKDYRKIAQAIIDTAVKHDFDPVFLLSVIEYESAFDPTRKGSLDEIGLMQLRPATAEWIAQKYGLKFVGRKTLRDPVANIRIGTAYMDYLRENYDFQARLYISAYNMGERNVDSLVEKNVWPRAYASHVMRYYVDFYAQIRG